MKLAKPPTPVMIWWLGFCLVMVGLELSWLYGVVNFIYENDDSILAFELEQRSLRCRRHCRAPGWP